MAVTVLVKLPCGLQPVESGHSAAAQNTGNASAIHTIFDMALSISQHGWNIQTTLRQQHRAFLKSIATSARKSNSAKPEGRCRKADNRLARPATIV
ncbi:MAG: hypothetical protein ACKN9T_05750, partial [Candidatus Methylumidiphilus sp.]